MVSDSEIAIIDIGIGNINSVYNAIFHLGYDPIIVKDPNYLHNYKHIILPGVGHFSTGSKSLQERGFDKAIISLMQKEHYLLGICLGMQLLFENSEEAPGYKGLSLIDGSVHAFPNNIQYPTPHIGWNSLSVKSENSILDDIKDDVDFYFVHSFFVNTSPDLVIASCNYSVEFSAIVNKENIYGIQFHPEKSQANGLKILENFCSL